MSGQEDLDGAFKVTPRDRVLLRSGKIPAPIRRNLRAEGLSSYSGGLPALSWVLVLGWFGYLVATHPTDPPRLEGKLAKILSALVFLALPAAFMLGCRLLDWGHELKVFLRRPRLRIVEGRVHTTRLWAYGYGDVYSLQSHLHWEDESEEPVWLREILGRGTIRGWARVYLATIPSRTFSSPFYEKCIAIEVGEDTIWEEREPGRPPPEELNLFGRPAD